MLRRVLIPLEIKRPDRKRRAVLFSSVDYLEALAPIRRGHDRINRLRCQRRIQQISKRPNPIGNAKAHDRRCPQGFMDTERALFDERKRPQLRRPTISLAFVSVSMLGSMRGNELCRTGRAHSAPKPRQLSPRGPTVGLPPDRFWTFRTKFKP